MEVPLNWMNDYSKTHSNLSVFRTNCSSPIHFRVKLEKSRGSNPKKFGNFPALNVFFWKDRWSEFFRNLSCHFELLLLLIRRNCGISTCFVDFSCNLKQWSPDFNQPAIFCTVWCLQICLCIWSINCYPTAKCVSLWELIDLLNDNIIIINIFFHSSEVLSVHFGQPT